MLYLADNISSENREHYIIIDDVADAIEMTRDAIGVVGIDMEDDGETLPEPTAISEVKAGVNFSAILTAALKNELKIQSR